MVKIVFRFRVSFEYFLWQNNRRHRHDMGHCLCKVIKSRSFEHLTKETKDSSLFSEKDIAWKLGSSLEDVGLISTGSNQPWNVFVRLNGFLFRSYFKGIFERVIRKKEKEKKSVIPRAFKHIINNSNRRKLT